VLVLVRIVGRALIRQAGRRRLMPGRREVGGPSGSARPHDPISRLVSSGWKTPTCGPHHHACIVTTFGPNQFRAGGVPKEVVLIAPYWFDFLACA